MPDTNDINNCIHEIILTIVSMDEDDEGRPYPTSRVFRFEFEKYSQINEIVEMCHKLKLDGGVMTNNDCDKGRGEAG